MKAVNRLKFIGGLAFSDSYYISFHKVSASNIKSINYIASAINQYL